MTSFLVGKLAAPACQKLNKAEDLTISYNKVDHFDLFKKEKKLLTFTKVFRVILQMIMSAKGSEDH
jgi:hypothetical protein